MTEEPKSSPGFFQELKRRNVYKVAIGYVALAYLALEFVDLLIPSTRLPDWSDEFFLAIAILGFPIALIIGWVFELTSNGVEWTRPVNSESDRRGARIASWKPLLAAAVLIAGSFFLWSYLTRPDMPTLDVQDRSVAVLPFETLGAEQANAFTQGIHAGVLTRLSNVSGLDIISRTSVKAYTNTDKALPEIASELGAAWVVLAEVQEVGNNVLVNARLIRAADDRQIWAEAYQREISAETVFAIQSDLSLSIIKALQSRLSVAEEMRVAQIPTQSLEAYRVQVRGRQASDLRTHEGLQEGAALFQQAIDIDPNYADAWVGLAESLALLYDYGYSQDATLLDRAVAASEEAIRLDPGSGAANAVIGVVYGARGEGPKALEFMQKSIELQPNNADAHSWSSWGNMIMGFPDAAVEHGRNAVAVDPLSGESVSNLALAYLSVGDYESGLKESIHALQLLPGWTTGRLYQGTALYHLGRFEEAGNSLKDVEVEWAENGGAAAMALALLANGDQAGAMQVFGDIEAANDQFSIGLLHAAFGDSETAYQAWEQVEEWNAWATIAMRSFYPDILGPLREQPRFGAIIEHIDRELGIR